MVAKIVVGLGFGDEGKGKTVSWLCEKHHGRQIVVRFSGGQQAGHTVFHNGMKHIFSNYGSGTLHGHDSYFTEHCTIYPNTIYREGLVLKQNKITPVLYVHPLAKITTPYDIVYNRYLEKQQKHGSCGLGVGATMKRNIETPYKLYAVDTTYPEIFKQKLKGIRDYYTSLVGSADWLNDTYLQAELDLFDNVFDEGFTVKDYEHLYYYGNVVFEGSQGVLLDMDHGVFPNVTYANTTSKNAIEVCGILNFKEVVLVHVTRCYQTRHGRGWMSSEKPIKLINNEEEINVRNEWQEDFRVGELDYDLLEYANRVDSIYSKNKIVDKWLMVTCVDQRPKFKLNYGKFVDEYGQIYTSASPKNKSIKAIFTGNSWMV